MSQFRLGIDVGSTTTKLVLTENSNIVYHKYIRHFAKQKESIIRLLEEVSRVIKNNTFREEKVVNEVGRTYEDGSYVINIFFDNQDF